MKQIRSTFWSTKNSRYDLSDGNNAYNSENMYNCLLSSRQLTKNTETEFKEILFLLMDNMNFNFL